MTRIPDKNLTIIVMTNQANVSGDGLAQKISIAYDPDLGPKPAVEAPDPNPDFTKQLRDALFGLANRDTKQALFSKELAATMATGRGQMSLVQYAPFKEITRFAFCNIEADDPDRIFRYRVKTKDHSYIVGFWVTSDQKLFSTSIRPE